MQGNGSSSRNSNGPVGLHVIVATASRDAALNSRFWNELSPIYGLAGFTNLKLLRGGLTMLTPSLIIADPETCELTDMRALRALCQDYRHIPIAIVSSRNDIQAELDCLRAGARGMLPRNTAPSFYRRMIEAMLRGEMWFSRRAIVSFLKELGLIRLGGPSEERRDCLSEREVQVAALAMTGASNKEIAVRLDITVRTVKAHFSNIFAKLGITQRSDLMALDASLLRTWSEGVG